jgi:hypothetical protein
MQSRVNLDRGATLAWFRYTHFSVIGKSERNLPGNCSIEPAALALLPSNSSAVDEKSGINFPYTINDTNVAALNHIAAQVLYLSTQNKKNKTLKNLGRISKFHLLTGNG